MTHGQPPTTSLTPPVIDLLVLVADIDEADSYVVPLESSGLLLQVALSSAHALSS